MFAGSNVLHSCSCNQESYHEQRLAMTERCKYERQLNMKDSWRPHLEIPALAACDFRGFSNICSELLNSISTERNKFNLNVYKDTTGQPLQTFLPQERAQERAQRPSRQSTICIKPMPSVPQYSKTKVLS